MAKLPASETDKIQVSDLTVVISTASRLLTALTMAEPFKKANIGFAEWLALSIIVERPGMSNKQLARALGVTGQRINQICAALAKSLLISIEQSPEDSRRNVLKVTPKGKKHIETLNSELKSFLTTALKDRERSLKAAGIHLRVLARQIQAPPAESAGQAK